MSGRGVGRWLAALGLSFFYASQAGAVDVQMSVELDGMPGSCTGVVTACTEALDSGSLPAVIRVIWDVSELSTLNGYQLNVSWDASELTLMSAEPLFPDTGVPDGFTVAPDTDQGDSFPEGINGTGTQISKLILSAAGSIDLFALNFAITGPLGEDGDVDITWRPQGGGLSPGSVVLDNPDGADLVLVPEPGTMLGQLSALLILGALRRARCRFSNFGTPRIH